MSGIEQLTYEKFTGSDFLNPDYESPGTGLGFLPTSTPQPTSRMASRELWRGRSAVDGCYNFALYVYLPTSQVPGSTSDGR